MATMTAGSLSARAVIRSVQAEEGACRVLDRAAGAERVRPLLVRNADVCVSPVRLLAGIMDAPSCGERGPHI